MNNRNKVTDQLSRLDCRVLVREDFPDSQRMISFHLKQAGSEVFLANDRQIALDLALEACDRDSPYDAILMDIQMPEIEGDDATTILRGAGSTETIIAITAQTESHDRETGIQAGCDAYITKPVDTNQLIDLIQHKH